MTRRKARIAGAFYLLVFVTGGFALVGGRVGAAAGLIAGLLYIVVTVLFYGLFKAVNQWVSLIAAAVSLLGIAAGPLLKVNPLPLFGIYCLLIGYLIVRSVNVPRFLGFLMMFGMPCLKRENGKVVAGHWKDGGLTVKLTDVAQREDALEAGAQPFDPGMGRVMKEWVLVPETLSDEWLHLVEQAI